MNKEKKILPELRFPEFKNAKPWAETPLNKLAEKVVLRNTGSLITKVFTNSAIDGIVDQREYFDRDIADKNNLDNYYVVEPDDYVYNPRISVVAPVGPVSKNKLNETGAMSPLYTVFRFNEKENSFYEYYFKSNHWYESIRKVANTGARFDRISITDSILMDIPVLYPEPKEQQKIAFCLSSIDNLIEAQSQKLNALNDHKKGLMQNLFPQEGEKIPKFRFPEFGNDGEWVKKTLIQVYDFKVTNSFSRENLNYIKGEVKNIHYGDIHTKFNTLFDIENEDVPFINEDISIEKIKKENFCIEGDIILADASEDIDDIGKSIEIVNLNNHKIVSGLHTLLARQRECILTIGFGGYLFKSDLIRKQIQREAQGAKVLGISAGRIANIKLFYPKEFREQQKIASCLSALDNLIKGQSDKIEQLKEHKKGLMQSLFPNNNI